MSLRILRARILAKSRPGLGILPPPHYVRRMSAVHSILGFFSHDSLGLLRPERLQAASIAGNDGAAPVARRLAAVALAPSVAVWPPSADWARLRLKAACRRAPRAAAILSGALP
jgi:hypothetical protein